MKKIKQPSVQGKFYTNKKEELVSELKSFENNLEKLYPITTRAVIVPHAGYYFSGQLAFEGINYLSEKTKNIFIFAPSHRYPLEGLALSGYDEWLTLLGQIPVNQEINKILEKEFSAQINDDVFEGEHAVEIQVPIIQTIFQNVNIIPILVGKERFSVISDIINYFWQDKSNSFIISSDLSHFLKDKEARSVDEITANMIEEKEIGDFNYQQACGAVGILGLVYFANQWNFDLIRVGLINSSDKTGDKDRVVGYGCWILSEESKNNFLEKHYKDYILDICQKSIQLKLDNKYVSFEKIPPVLNQKGASFVTLEKNGRLRGCIGSIIAHRTLIDDLVENAKNAAFKDPRFLPVTKEEFDDLEIFVSLLSVPQKMSFTDEQDLLDQIQPFEDGLIIKLDNYQSVYLPSVWEQLPDKEDFLKSLKVKAGLPSNFFSTKLEVYRFYSVYLKK